MKKYILAVLLLFSGLTSVFAQEVKNIRVSQTGSRVNVLFDLAETGKTYKVDLFVTTNDGTTWIGPLKSVSGDVGNNVPFGSNKQIVWDIVSEKGLAEGYMQFKVVAEALISPAQRIAGYPAAAQTVTDIEGNVYKTVTIGTQVWMAENLKTTKYNDGANIPYNFNSNDSAKFGDFGYQLDIMLKKNLNNVYGYLYNWYMVKTGKLCPTGWHVPSDNEWTTLTNYLGGFEVAGQKMKFTSGWFSNDNGTNCSGFSALPGGYYFDFDTKKRFMHGYKGLWWSSTEVSTLSALHCYIAENYVISLEESKESGASVRCVRD